MFDDKLTFSDYVNQNIQKALMPKPDKLRLVQALIHSIFQYCYLAYDNSIAREDTERIQKLQNSTICFVYGLRWCDQVTSSRDTASES